MCACVVSFSYTYSSFRERLMRYSVDDGVRFNPSLRAVVRNIVRQAPSRQAGQGCDTAAPARMSLVAAWNQRPWRHKSPAWWAQRVTWYPDGCFGPYRSAQEGYSRRELAADAAVHLTGVSMGCVGALLMLERLADPACPAAVRVGLGVYACSVCHTGLEPRTNRQGPRQVYYSHI